jgi:hypothetical protein
MMPDGSGKKRRGIVHPMYWKKTVKEAFKNDSLRIIIELIKNSADSYTRMYKRGEKNPPFEIFVRIRCERSEPPYLMVLDNAEGMDYEKLEEALQYGAPTSIKEDTEAVTSGEKGVGLKDALMALKDNQLITIKNGLINERIISPDFQVIYEIENNKVTEEERNKLGIQENGTLIMGQLPPYFHERKFSTICEKLEKHYLLRKLLQNHNYKVYAIDETTGEKRLLEYKPPEKEKQVLKESFMVDYNGKSYKVYLEINKSKNELKPGKPYGDAGLLFFYGEYSVVDFTFFSFDADPSFYKFFGEVQMDIKDLIRDPEESPIVDEKRRGLISDHPFCKKLIDEINKRLKSLQNEVGPSEYSFDEEAKREYLKQLNNLCKEIKGKGPLLEPPIKPEFFEFYPPWTEIKEYEPKRHFLVINPSNVTNNLEIKIYSNNKKITVKPSIISISEEDIKKDFIIKQIELYSEEAGIKGEVFAESKDLRHTSKIGVEVVENPMFSPQNGFAFVPDKTTIIDGGEKEVQLCISKDLIRSSKEIVLSSESPISCPGTWTLPSSGNLEKYIIKNIILIKIPIKVKGKNHIGEKATIIANYEGKSASLDIKVIQEPSIAGLFRNLRFSPKEEKRISRFIKEEGLIEVYEKHPLIKKYMEKNGFKKREGYLVFLADTITREVIKAIVESAVESDSSSFPIFNQDHPEPEIERYIIEKYYENGPKLHDLTIQFLKKIKIEESH